MNTQADARARQTLDIDNPRYASFVFDVNSGTALRQSNPDSLRHPASLTKIMTLYMLFERLESGKLKLNSPLVVSAEAASQAPTKLGLKPGQIITVEEAIKGLVTKSANDAAVVIAEALAGSEDEFAQQMTRKARALGMTRTTYRNASGLPDDDQVTTARDQARLGIAIQERFPRYYRYFALTSFTYRGETMRNHNHLLGQVAGVDGIKTGYTRASGFNLVTSVRRGAKHIIAVVLGGNTASQRDAHMRDLIDRYIALASIKRPEVAVAQVTAPTEIKVEPKPEAQTENRPAPMAEPRVEAKVEAPIQPRTELRVETAVQPRPKPRITIVSVLPPPSETASNIIPSPSADANDPITPTAVKTVPIKAANIPLPDSQLTAFAPTPELAPVAVESRRIPGPAEAELTPPEEPATESVTGNIQTTPIPLLVRPYQAPSKPTETQNGWVVQVGAFDQEGEAKQRLTLARSKAASLLKSANPYTERTVKGDKTIFRARFAGFDRAQAEAVCKLLQRNDVGCIALRI